VRAVVQRVTSSAVEVDGKVVGSIGRGLLVLLGVGREDSEQDALYLADKISGLRIFEDADGKMNLAVADVGGSILAISQFTLYGDCRKGRRPGFSAAAPPERANSLYEYFVSCLHNLDLDVATGVFRAEMKVQLVNDGPVTMLLDSRKEF